MEPSSPYRPRVSRETRLLLTAGLAAIAALWLLARIRFDERAVTPNPLPSVFGQIASGPKYDDLAAEIAQVQARVQPVLHVVGATGTPPGVRQASPGTAAIKLRGDLVVTLAPAGSHPEQWQDAVLLARDPASGLAVARIPNAVATPSPVPWTPRRPRQARYLVATDVSPQGVSLRPAFVGSLEPIDTALWSDPIWAVPEETDLVPGSLLFTANGEFAGLVIRYGDAIGIVPGETVLQEAERLLTKAAGAAGVLGIEVQDLTQPLASATGAGSGVLVSRVERGGPASGLVAPVDVIEAVNGEPLASRHDWDVRAARVVAGETLTLRVRRRGETREVTVTASAPAANTGPQPLGLVLRERPRIGAEVVRVEPASAADRADLRPGDVITLAADVQAPTPNQVTRAFAGAAAGQPLIVGVARGGAHHVTTLER
jgi:S1-C subfamily serine protease